MNLDNMTFEIGPIRPPSEAGSLLLRVTQGCTWNKCKFCDLYRGTPFRAYSAEEVKRSIDGIAAYRETILELCGGTPGRQTGHQAVMTYMASLSEDAQQCCYMVYNWMLHGGDTVFLQDGNTVVLSSGRLADVLRYLKEKIPGIKRITTYGRAENLSRVPVEQLKELADAGLDRIHSGFESGSDAVLFQINKGCMSEQEIMAGRNVKAAGIELSVYFMPGIGGKKLSEENAVETARVVSAINPDFVRLRTGVIKPGSGLWEDVQSGSLTPCTDLEKLLEIRTLIERIEGCDGMLKSDHIINLLPEVEGNLRDDRGKMLATIDAFLNLPEPERKRFQLARRIGRVETPEQVALLDPQIQQKIDHILKEIDTEDAWEELLNRYLQHYI